MRYPVRLLDTLALFNKQKWGEKLSLNTCNGHSKQQKFKMVDHKMNGLYQINLFPDEVGFDLKGIISTKNHRRWAPAREGRPSEFLFPKGNNNVNLMYLFGFMDGLKLPPIAIDEGRLKSEYFIRLVNENTNY